VNRPAHILASIVTAVVLAATPAVATLCAMLCPSAAVSTVAKAEGHHGHHATEAAHDGHGAEPVAADAPHHGSAPALQLTAQSAHACCDGESLAPRALTARRVDSGAISAAAVDVAAPLVPFVTVALAHAPAARPGTCPASRPPLVLRI
jgi:hypothetical protein